MKTRKNSYASRQSQYMRQKCDDVNKTHYHKVADSRSSKSNGKLNGDVFEGQENK